MNYWLIKSEPFKYSWDELVKDKWTYWDGVRNYAARLNLRAMEVGDHCFFYHSNEGLEIVGIARVIKEAYQDPTTDDDRWVAVDVEPVRALKRPIGLKEIKATEALGDMDLVRLARLSVSKVKPEEYELILKLSEQDG